MAFFFLHCGTDSGAGSGGCEGLVKLRRVNYRCGEEHRKMVLGGQAAVPRAPRSAVPALKWQRFGGRRKEEPAVLPGLGRKPGRMCRQV